MTNEQPIRQVIFGDSVLFVNQKSSVLPRGDGQKKGTIGRWSGPHKNPFRKAVGNWPDADAKRSVAEGANASRLD